MGKKYSIDQGRLSERIKKYEKEIKSRSILEYDLKKRLVFEKMLADISSRAVSVKDMTSFFNDVMNRMGKDLDVSRIFICEYHPDSETYDSIHEWDAKGFELTEKGTRNLSFPWVTNQWKRGEICNIGRVEDVPAEAVVEKELFLLSGIKSALSVPLFINDEFYGFIGFDECRHTRDWYDEDINILTTAAQIITKVIENKRGQDEITKQSCRLSAIFRSVEEAIITVDKEMNVIGANEAAEKICGISCNEIIGQPLINYNGNCEQSCHMALDQTVKSGKKIKEYRIECNRKNREKQTVLITSSPLLGDSNELIGAVLVIRDITRLNRLERELKERTEFHDIIGKSKRMQEIFTLMEDLADYDTTVIITGQSGTGKEMVARALHQSSSRAFKPFVAVDCSALAESLLESELFGHTKGAFTGAIRDREGRFEAANGGTLFLDEIGNISPLIQLKLLRVLEEKVIVRVGETNPKKVDVRVITATNRDLKESIRRGTFREDLYYRLKILEINLPALRERPEDIPLLIAHFCDRFNRRYNKRIKGVSDDVMNVFIHYPWPGNIRELRHIIERAYVLCRSETIQLTDIPNDIKNHHLEEYPERVSPISKSPEELINALMQTGWNKAKAARLLGIDRKTLYRRLTKYNIKKPDDNV